MKRSKKPMPPQMPLRPPCRKQPPDQFSLAAGQVRLYLEGFAQFFTYTPFLYDWLLYPTYWIRQSIVSGCFLYFMQTLAFTASAIYHLDLGISGISGKKGWDIDDFSGGQHLNDLLRISHCICGRTRWGEWSLASEATPGRHDELPRLCSRQPGRQQ
jgi:hypothetical protein